MISPQEYLMLAHRLTAGATEAEWRSAISRSYYAAFHVARNLLNDLGFTVPRADPAHQYLWLRLLNSGNPQVQVAASDLNSLRGERNLADYDLHRNVTQNVARMRVATAQKIIQTLNDARQE